MRTIIATAAAFAVIAAAAHARLPRGHEHVSLDPADFSTHITNPWWPMPPGRRWVSRESTPGGPLHRIVVTVTRRTRRLGDGIVARAVHDRDTLRGRVMEDTYDWYAQDRAGNVWYMGEDTTAYEHGHANTEGSWQAGRDGAEPGVIVPAHPRSGQHYRQEEYRGHAEDRASVVGRREQVEVPAGHYRHVLMTRETTPLEPRSLEFKFLARGVGPVLAISVSGDDDREELVRVR